jgi:hypothetical protein
MTPNGAGSNRCDHVDVAPSLSGLPDVPTTSGNSALAVMDAANHLKNLVMKHLKNLQAKFDALNNVPKKWLKKGRPSQANYIGLGARWLKYAKKLDESTILHFEG